MSTDVVKSSFKSSVLWHPGRVVYLRSRYWSVDEQLRHHDDSCQQNDSRVYCHLACAADDPTVAHSRGFLGAGGVPRPVTMYSLVCCLRSWAVCRTGRPSHLRRSSPRAGQAIAAEAALVERIRERIYFKLSYWSTGSSMVWL